MEKIVTKIGDVTIERRVTKPPLQKFTPDPSVRNILPHNAAKLEDLVKSYPQSQVFKQDNPEKQYDVNSGIAKSSTSFSCSRSSQMGKGLDLLSEMEQKSALPKGISWDYKPSENAQYGGGRLNEMVNRSELKDLMHWDHHKNRNQVQKRSELPDTRPPDMSRYGGISIERKRLRIPGHETDALNRFDRRLSGDGSKSFTSYISRSNFEKPVGDQVDLVKDERNAMQSQMENKSPSLTQPLAEKHYSFLGTNCLQSVDVERQKKSAVEMNSGEHMVNSFNNMNFNIQHSQNKTFTSKSPIQISSDEEKPGGEDVDYDLKGAVFDGFDNDSDEYDEEEEEDDINAEPDNFENEVAMHDINQKMGDERQNMLKPKNFCRSGSPIVLSSEDEKNDEDVVEVMNQSKTRNLINLQSQPHNLSQGKNFIEPIVVDDSVRSDLAKYKESKTSYVGASDSKHETAAKSELEGSNTLLGNKRKSDKEKTNHNVADTAIDNKTREMYQYSRKVADELNRFCPNNTENSYHEETCSKDMSESNSNREELNERKTPENKMRETKVDSEKSDEDTKEDHDEDECILKSEETELPASDGSEGDEKEPRDDITKSNMSDIVCDDLMELMKKGEIEGEVEDEKDYESEEDKKSKKSGLKRKPEEGSDDETDETKTKSKKKKSEKTEEGDGKEEDDKNIDKSKVTSANLRKNIREVMDETKLDEATLSAQRQEAERLKRLQDQQRIIRELQKQIVMNRQSQKSQSRVLSLLQGNSQTSILKTSSATTPQPSTQAKSPNHVLVKLSNGQQTSLNNKKMIELLKNSKNKVTLSKPSIPKTLLKQGMVSPSVSIAPIAKKEPPVDDKKKKKGDVVTLSSDSEDDCIVLSEEDESEPEEDPTNSGMHTSDKYNVPDEQGRVIVNVGHPETESDIFLAPQIARVIKPHQIGGIRFLYDNVVESIDRFQSSTGFGCILAHSMGLGKTLQIVSFSDIFLRYTSAKTILCIMPINTIQNWLAEFNMWLPKEKQSDQDVRCRDFDLFIVNESLKNISSRSKVILDWHRSGGVLLMGYELFRLLSLKKSYKSKKKKKDCDVKEDEAKNKELMEEVYSALVRPGPDLVICDEGHRIKNSHATTSQALKQIRTKRRIVLTGYPLQNNLLEYWCMVDFVRPNYLGSKTEFSNMFERPIQNGQCIDSTPQDKRLMRYRAHVLHSLLEGFVQRRSHAVLQTTLPEKEEYVLLLRFTPFQRKLYDTFMNEVVRTVAVPNPLKAFAVCCKIWNHPDVLYNFLKKKGEEIDLDLEEALPSSLQPSNYPFGQTPPDGMSQFPPSPMAPPWPKRGPGSRGGKARQSAANRRPGRGRKPAATVPPNLMSGCDQKDPNTEGFNQSNYPSAYPDFHHQNSSESSMDGDRLNRNFGVRSFNQYNMSDYGSHSNFTGSGYDAKNPLENLEDLSTGDFQSKRFYPQQGESGMQSTNFPSPSCMQQNSTFPQNMNQTNNQDGNGGFNNSMNRNDSRFGQSDNTKSYQYNQNYSSEFYGANFQAQPSSTDFEQANKMNFNRTNTSRDSSVYYQNSRYNGRENNMSYNVQSANNMDSGYQGYHNRNSDQNFQQGSVNKPYQNQNSNSGYNESTCNSNPALNYQNTMTDPQQKSCPSDMHIRGNYNNSLQQEQSSTSSESNYQRNGYPGSVSNFSNNFRESGFSQADSERDINCGSNFQDSNNSFNRSNYSQDYWSGSAWPSCGFDSSKANPERCNDFMQEDKYLFDGGSDKNESGKFSGEDTERKSNPTFGVRIKSESELDSGFGVTEEEKIGGGKVKEDIVQCKKDDEVKEVKKEEFKSPEVPAKKEDQNLPYDWATDLFKSYVTGIIENSSKMEVFFHILTETINLSDRLLVFSQSLLTLDLIEDYLHRRNVPNRDEKWAKNRNYFRLDGSTPGLEREKLINEFNNNPNVFIFLVSTRAGSLGINLVGANRVVVFDASWNPCHDTQAVCRVYRYGQQKPCFVYRLVMDSCLEKKIYDRQINKQGMADRVVDELNPDAHLSIKEVTNLCWDDQEDTVVRDFSHMKDKYNDQIIKVLLENCSKLLSKEPFQHESLLIDRKEKKLSQAEKRLAKRSYELEKQAANQPKNIYSFFPNTGGPRNFVKPIASVRPMQNEMASRVPPMPNRSKWIPAEVWQKQGMSAQEMTLPLDVVIPTNTPDKTSIVLKAGQRVMILKSPKGIYMQLENGKIIAIRTAFKVGQGQGGLGSQSKGEEMKKEGSLAVSSALKNNPNVTITSKSTNSKLPPPKTPFVRGPDKKLPISITPMRSKQIVGKTKPLLLSRKFQSVTPEIKQRLLSGKSSFENQEDKTVGGEDMDDVIVTKDTNDETKFDAAPGLDIAPPDQKKVDEPRDQTTGKEEMNNTLETLRKVTENISKDDSKSESRSENPQVQMNLKNYRHNFSSQLKSKTLDSDDEKEVKVVNEINAGSGKTGEDSGSFSGNENVQNWLMNQSYPPVDPYGNYFPSYYGYGHGPGSMVNPYDGFYPNNYGHSLGRTGNAPAKQDYTDNSKTASYQQPQPPSNSSMQQTQNSSTSRNSSMYPYPTPYQYPYNYPNNPGFNNQGYPFSGQNQVNQNQQSMSSNPVNSVNQNQSYDNSMYSAFHRPDGHFQNSENPYSSSYRPPYPNASAPGFFPYNAPYRPYPDPNYHYGPNFNPYVHPPGYGYPMENSSSVNSNNTGGFNQHSAEPATNSS